MRLGLELDLGVLFWPTGTGPPTAFPPNMKVFQLARLAQQKLYSAGSQGSVAAKQQRIETNEIEFSRNGLAQSAGPSLSPESSKIGWIQESSYCGSMGHCLWDILYLFLTVSQTSFTKSQLLKLKLPQKSSLVISGHLVKMVVNASKGQLKWSPRLQGRKWLIPGSFGLCDWVLHLGLKNFLQLVCAKFFFCLSATLYSPDPLTESSQESHSEKNRYKAG